MSEPGTRRTSPSARDAVLAARRYYLDGASKSEIAGELGLSRFQVARLLDTARQNGIVRIEIQEPPDVDVELAFRLAERYGLRDAVVVKPLDSSEQSRRERLGRAGADVLSRAVKPADILGISWGRTLHAMARRLTSLPGCAVVQMVGSVPTLDLDVNSMELVRRVGDCAGGPVYPLHVPLLVDTAEMAAALRRDPFVSRTVGMFDRLTLAVVGIGAWTAGESTVRAALAPDVAAEIDAAGGVADICATVLDSSGREVSAAGLPSRSLAITPQQLRNVPEVVAVAGGASKAAAILAVLRSGLVHRLITDEEAAQLLLAA